MRTILLILACVAVGYGLAYYRFIDRTAQIENVAGIDPNMEEAIKRAKAPDAKKPGRIEVVNGQDLDFGTMRQGSRRSHKFVFKNVGEAPVKVWFKSSTCKCTVGKFTEQLLAAGEQTDVELEWLAEGGIDHFSQTATIATDAIDQEEIKLSIHGQIGQSIVFDPPEGRIGEFLTSAETEFSGRLYSFEEAPLEIRSGAWMDKVLSKSIQCEVGEVKKLEKGEIPQYADARYMMDFKIRLLPGIPAGNIAGNLVFARKTLASTPELINYPVRGRAIAPIRVVAGVDYNEDRNIFTLGTAKQSEGLKKSFLLAIKSEDVKSIDGIDLKLSKISPSNVAEFLKVTVGEPRVSPTQRIYPVTLEIPPGSPLTELDGTFSKDFAKIVLETNMESAPQFPMYLKLRVVE